MLPSSFHPLVRAWFSETYGNPTAVQGAAWPAIAAGEHVLALAPTGSGKTLTAFLAAISRFVDGTYPTDTLSVLYVSPLKALNEDIRRNLLEPTASLAVLFAREGAAFPDIRVETRSGDTPQAQRRRFLLKPPAILALTPESLAILLLNPRGRQVLSTTRYLILDEIHAVLGTKRGAFLSCQVDRLGLAAGEFQRVALSATARPPEAAAAFVGGLGPGGLRSVRIVSPPSEKRIELLVDFPEVELSLPPRNAAEADRKTADRYGPRYTALVNAVLDRMGMGRQGDSNAAGVDTERRRTVLVFTDSRRRAERIASLINRRAAEMGADQQIAYAHHGSLSTAARRAVEQRLAEGRLPCVVATGSLELGIDIGSVDEVILAGSPSASSTALQRIGRSGHGVGMVSRGRIIPFHGMDLVMAAALEGAVGDREIEETYPIENPLDILAQIVLALCVEKKRHTEELYKTLRGFYVFRKLPRPAYDAVIRMLTGHYAAARIRELKPRLYLDRDEGIAMDAPQGELSAVDGTLQLLYMSGGVIANRGYYSLRLPDGTKIGELDEEFVWERRLGDSFEFGTRSWSVTAIGSEAVEAVPLDKSADYAPFWKAEAAFRSPVLVRRALELFDKLGGSDAAGDIAALTPGLSEPAREQLLSFLLSQRKAQGTAPLPGLGRFPIEIIDDPLTRGDAYSVMLHTFQGGAVNYPLAMALAQDLEERIGVRVGAMQDDNAALITLPRSITDAPEDALRRSLLSLGESGGKGLSRGEALFRKRLEASGVFGAAFREAAERSMLLPKAAFGKRTPLWITRQRSKRLFDAVSPYDDFPVTAEAWRSCIRDQFDMEGFGALLAGMRDGTVGLSFFRSRSPSPFARDMVWKETNTLMYEYDERPDLRGRGEAGKLSLGDQIIREALGKGASRPALSEALAADFGARLRRELPLWTPTDALGLGEWVKERIAIPQDEWETLIAALPAELLDTLSLDPGLGGRISLIQREGAALASMVHRDWAAAWKQEAEAQLGPWLRYEGPVSLERVAAVFGLSAAEAEGAVDALAESGDLVRDVSVKAGSHGAVDAGLVCDRENLDLLLRLTRKKARPAIQERPATLIAPFLALRQGIARGQSPGAAPWETLLGYAAPAALWESDIFPARQAGYAPETLDREIAAGNLLWYGSGRERIGFCGPEDLTLIFAGYRPSPFNQDSSINEPPDSGYFDVPRDFWEIKERLGKDALAAAQELWGEAWKGLLSADTFEPVRRGVAGGFIPKSLQQAPDEGVPLALPASPWARRRAVPRALRDRWKAGPPVLGKWFSLASDPADSMDTADSLDEEELNRDRVRLLANRWGVLARPLLEREEPALSWGRLLPAIRRLELAGELVAGRFFAGIDSLQFAPADIGRELEAAEAETGIYWMNAVDPASPAGLGVSGLDERLPPRAAASRLCFRGASLVAISARNGRDVRAFIPPDDQDILEALGFIAIKRPGPASGKKILVESVNGKPAARSEYTAALKALGFLPDRSYLVLW